MDETASVTNRRFNDSMHTNIRNLAGDTWVLDLIWALDHTTDVNQPTKIDKFCVRHYPLELA